MRVVDTLGFTEIEREQYSKQVLSDLSHNYNKLGEMLRKSSPSDLESGITLASEAIENHEMDAKLFLLRAKFIFKLVRLGSLKCNMFIFCP